MRHVIGLALLAVAFSTAAVSQEISTTAIRAQLALQHIEGCDRPNSSAENCYAESIWHDAALRREMALNFAARSLDYGMTIVVLRSGGHEANPMMRPVFGRAEGKNVAAAAIVNAVFTYALGIVAQHEKAAGNPNWRRTLRWNSYLHFGCGSWNAAQYHLHQQSISSP